jgi:thioesterase domain-containing protein
VILFNNGQHDMTYSTDDMKDFLYQHIPLAAAMQVNIDSYDGQHLVLSAPLDCNHNDKGTAFAGSISSLATMSGWIALMLWTKDHYDGEFQVAVAHADIHYKKPVLTDFKARATLPHGDALTQLRKTLAHKGRGKAQLHIEVYDEHGVAVIQVAEYAVWRVKE